jgi:hypothetical protein
MGGKELERGAGRSGCVRASKTGKAPWRASSAGNLVLQDVSRQDEANHWDRPKTSGRRKWTVHWSPVPRAPSGVSGVSGASGVLLPIKRWSHPFLPRDSSRAVHNVSFEGFLMTFALLRATTQIDNYRVIHVDLLHFLLQ